MNKEGRLAWFRRIQLISKINSYPTHTNKPPPWQTALPQPARAVQPPALSSSHPCLSNRKHPRLARRARAASGMVQSEIYLVGAIRTRRNSRLAKPVPTRLERLHHAKSDRCGEKSVSHLGDAAGNAAMLQRERRARGRGRDDGGCDLRVIKLDRSCELPYYRFHETKLMV